MAGTAIVRRPSPRLDEGIVTHLERAPVDAERTGAERRRVEVASVAEALALSIRVRA